MFKRLLYPALFIVSGHAIAVEGFNALQNNSESFVRSTCGGFVKDKKATTSRDEKFVLLSNQQDLFDACGSMVHSVNALPGRQGASKKDRALDVESLAGAFQNIVPEETLTPMSIASNTSSLNTSAINSRLSKIRFGGGAGDDLFSTTRLGFFINGMGGFGETDQTVEQNGSDFETKGVVAGFDYKVMDNLIVGMAGSYSAFDLDFNNTINVSGGSVDSDSYTITAYTNYSQDGGYVEGVFSYGWSQYDIDRKIFIGSNTAIGVVDRTAFASPDGEQLSATLAGGYDFHTGGLSYGPYTRVSYFSTYIDQYDETGAKGLNLRVDEHKADSLETVLGAQISYALSHSFGVIVPHLKAEWHHEFKNNQRSFGIRYVNDPRNNTNVYQSYSSTPDRNFFNISAGLSADLKYGFQTFFNYETILGLSNIETHKFSAGIRMEF